MKKLFIIFIAVLFMAIVGVSPAIAEDSYISIGGTYAIENFDAGVDFDNTEGLNLRAGHVLDKNISIELTYDYLPGFTWTGDIITAEADIETLMLAGKLSTGEDIKPYITAGIGVMRGELTAAAFGLSASVSESDICAKAGAGIDYFIEDNVSVGIESSYVIGFGDLDRVDHTTITCGIAFYF